MSGRSRGRAAAPKGGGGLRISAGELRGRRLTARDGVRPTESRVREAVIDRWRPRLAGARVLDLFAGSGAVGLSALSCGAASCLFVDRERLNLEAIAGAAREWGIVARVQTVVGNLPGELYSALLDEKTGEPFDLIFADPPYAFDEYGTLVAWAAARLAGDGELVIEHSIRTETPDSAPGLLRSATKTHGECALSVFQPLESVPPTQDADSKGPLERAP